MKPDDLARLRTFATIPDIYLTSNDQRQVQKALLELLNEYERLKK